MTPTPSPAWPDRLVAFALAMLAVGPAAAESPPGRLIPLAVSDGRCECVLPTGRPDDKFFLVVGAVACGAGPFRVRIRTGTTNDPVSVPEENVTPDAVWVRRTADVAGRQARARKERIPFDEYPAQDHPPPHRVFHLFVRGVDFQDAEGYAAVPADLCAVGRRCQVYVEHDCADLKGLQPTIDDAVRTFDEAVYPRGRRSLGRCLDVDRDGRFTIFFSGRLDLMAGKGALSGFVRASDFYRDVAAPFGNRADMMYLNTDLKPGPYLHTVLAHEYTHAVECSEHVFGDYLPGAPRQDEEAWLNEAVAHLAEDLNDFSWANLDYRVSAFLSDPSAYPLAPADYRAAGLWRNPGCRGATYLFLRWCVDRYGTDLLARLVQSNLEGTANLEAATGEPFAELFRGWTAALALGWTPGKTPLRPLDVRQRLGARLLCGPRLLQVALDGGWRDVDLAGTSAAYLLLHSPGGTHSRVTITADAGAALQVSLIRLPEGSARLTLRREPGSRPGACRLALTAHDADVTLEDAAWERRAPAVSGPEDTSWRPDQPAGEAMRAWFGSGRLKADETRTSGDIPLPDDTGREPILFKMSGRDETGHAVTAWNDE